MKNSTKETIFIFYDIFPLMCEKVFPFIHALFSLEIFHMRNGQIEFLFFIEKVKIICRRENFLKTLSSFFILRISCGILGNFFSWIFMFYCFEVFFLILKGSVKDVLRFYLKFSQLKREESTMKIQSFKSSDSFFLHNTRKNR